MKQTKKLFAVIMTMLLTLAIALPVFAATITIENPESGQTYNAYKIFDVTTDGGSAYAYTIDSSSDWFSVVNAWADTSDTTEGEKHGLTLTAISDTAYSVAFSGSAADFAAYLYANIPSNITPDGTATGSSEDEETESSITISLKDAGYYFVTSSLGSLCVLNTAADSVTINEKNTVPDIEKESDKTTASVGDKITFTLTITPGNNSLEYIVHDTMSAGLALDPDSFTVKQGVSDVSEENYETIIADSDDTENSIKDDCTFEIAFTQNYIAGLTENDTIVITYEATLTPAAITKDEETNKVKLQYGNDYSAEKTVKVFNYGFSLVKTDQNGTLLSGAQFKLFKDEGCTTEVKLVKEADGTYRPATIEEISADEEVTEENKKVVAYIEAGNVEIDGLGNGDYYLKETKAPDGYNLLTSPTKVTINSNDQFVEVTKGEDSGEDVYTGGIRIENNTGGTIPSTGGIGTRIFYILGSMMLLGAGIVLVTRRRMNGAK